MTPTILATPLAIHDAVTVVFPSAKVNMTIIPNLRVDVEISKKISPMTLYFALDNKKFQETLQHMKNHMTQKLTPSDILTVNPEDFSLTSTPLTNWQKWQRVMWERKGGDCINCILDYLVDQHHDDVISLGLAHFQVDANPTEEDLAYFREIPKRLQYAHQDSRADYLKNLSTLYPNIYKKINSI
jgi:hypothetical protein